MKEQLLIKSLISILFIVVMNDLSNLDLNLLRVFQILMEERSVSRAADRLHLSQPATSNALNRLRDALGDKLLVRNGNIMEPTETATLLLPHIRDALVGLNVGLECLRHFDPATLEGSIRVGIDQYSLEIFGLKLFSKLSKAAPNLHIEFINIKPHQNENDLEYGRLDFILGQIWDETPGLDHDTIATEHFVGLVRSGHPILADASCPSLDSYLSYPHLLFSEVGRVRRNVDYALAQQGLSRKISATVPSVTLAAEVVEQTDTIVNLGERMAHALSQRYDLAQFTIPMEVYGFNIGLLWPSRNTNAHLNRWFREIAQAL